MLIDIGFYDSTKYVDESFTLSGPIIIKGTVKQVLYNKDIINEFIFPASTKTISFAAKSFTINGTPRKMMYADGRATMLFSKIPSQVTINHENIILLQEK